MARILLLLMTFQVAPSNVSLYEKTTPAVYLDMQRLRKARTSLEVVGLDLRACTDDVSQQHLTPHTHNGDGTMNTQEQANLLDGYRECAKQRDELLAALKTTKGYLMNALIDIKTGAPKKTAIDTIEGGLQLADAALALLEKKS